MAHLLLPCVNCPMVFLKLLCKWIKKSNEPEFESWLEIVLFALVISCFIYTEKDKKIDIYFDIIKYELSFK